MSSQLEFTKEIERNTANIYQKIKSVIPALVGISFKTVQYMVKNITEKIKTQYDISCNK